MSRGRFHPIGIAMSAVEEMPAEALRNTLKNLEPSFRRMQEIGFRSFSSIHLTIKMDYKSNYRQVDRAMEMAKIEILYTWGEFLRSEAQLRSPVDTGNLRDSNDYKVQAELGQVLLGNSVDYAIWVHEGTSKQQSQPWLRTAVMQNLPKLKQIAEEVYIKHLGGR